MKIYGWRKLFDSATLEAAEEYLGRDDVIIWQCDEGHIHAKVYGHHEHTVDIRISGHTVIGMDCSCSYSRSGGHCNHMAAVLYACEELDDDMEDSEEERNDKLVSIIDSMTEVQIKSYLRHLAMNSSDIRDTLFMRFSTDADAEMAIRIKTLLADCSDGYEDETNGMELSDVTGYIDALLEILEEYVPRFIDGNLYAEAFDIVESAMSYMGFYLIEPDDDTDRFFSHLGKYLKQVLSSVDDQTREDMLSKIEEYEVEDSYNFALSDFAFDFRNGYSDSHEYQSRMLKARIDELNGDGWKYLDDWYLNHVYDRTSLYIVDMVLKGFKTDFPVEAFMEMHMDSRSANERMLEYYRKNGFSEKEIGLLLKILDGNNMDLDGLSLYSDDAMDEMAERAYYLMLIRKSYEEVVDFIMDQVSTKKRYCLVCHLRSLKNNIDERRWNKVISEINMAMNRKGKNLDERLPLVDFMLAEGIYGSVFNIFEAKNFKMESFHAVANSLISEDEARTFEIHLKGLCYMMKKAMDRSSYAAAIGELAEVIELYPDGDEKALLIVNAWKENHPNRKAMFEELEKAGF